MTTTATPPGPPSGGTRGGHPIVGFASSLSTALDRLADTPTWSMARDEQRAALVELRRQRARLEELELRVLVQADRDRVGSESGSTSTAAWLAHETGATRQSCFADVRLAQRLDEDFPATRRALAAGQVDSARARVVVATVDALDEEYDDLPPGTREAAEAHLLDLAGRFDALMLRRLGKRLVEVVCPQAADEAEGRALAQEEERARRLTYLSLRDNGDGTVEGRFRMPTLHAQLLRKAVEALTSPRRVGAGRIDPVTGTKLPASTLLGLGFLELLENHLTALPSVSGSPFTLLVTIGVDALTSGIGVGVLETGQRISAGEARRLACKAGLIPVVLGGDSMPLDVGREQRLFDRYQKIAINARHGNVGCAAANCDRPPAWVEFHHLDPWHQGGATAVANGIPLCAPHHHMADHPDSYRMSRLPSGRVRFTRRT